MIAATAFTPVPVNLGVNTDSGARRFAEVSGEATAVPQLFITPRVRFFPDRGGAIGYGDGYMLVHGPTGYPLLRGMDTDTLRSIAEALAAIDWDWLDMDAFKESGDFKRAGLVVRDHQLAEPTSAEHPAYDAWGKGEKGKGNGLKRAAVPMALDILADLQRCHNRIHRDGNDSLRPDLPPAEGETKGKPNPEWHFAIIQQVQDFGLAFLLLALHAVDPAVADSAAAALADQWESGDSIGEWAWEWHESLLKGEPVELPGIPTVALAAPA